jgi:2-amino-4-hydroxy-6-hydroxymethyldihydropteridine diphosphokinase
MNIAYLGLGSNLGNRLAFLRGGRDSLMSHTGIQLCSAAGIYETEPLGGPADSPRFLNTVLGIETTLTPRALLEACMSVENEFGRTRSMIWAPRTLDIDILLYADQVVDEPDLQIPHPGLHQRTFVLAPLAEIAPELMHPVLRRTVYELLTSRDHDNNDTLFRETW